MSPHSILTAVDSLHASASKIICCGLCSGVLYISQAICSPAFPCFLNAPSTTLEIKNELELCAERVVYWTSAEESRTTEKSWAGIWNSEKARGSEFSEKAFRVAHFSDFQMRTACVRFQICDVSFNIGLRTQHLKTEESEAISSDWQLEKCLCQV